MATFAVRGSDTKNELVRRYTLLLSNLQKKYASDDSDRKPNAKFYDAWKSVMDDVEIDLMRTLPQNVWDSLTPALLSTFWSLSLADLKIPDVQYDNEVTTIEHGIAKMKAELKDPRDVVRFIDSYRNISMIIHRDSVTCWLLTLSTA